MFDRYKYSSYLESVLTPNKIIRISNYLNNNYKVSTKLFRATDRNIKRAFSISPNDSLMSIIVKLKEHTEENNTLDIAFACVNKRSKNEMFLLYNGIQYQFSDFRQACMDLADMISEVRKLDFDKMKNEINIDIKPYRSSHK